MLGVIKRMHWLRLELNKRFVSVLVSTFTGLLIPHSNCCHHLECVLDWQQVLMIYVHGRCHHANLLFHSVRAWRHCERHKLEPPTKNCGDFEGESKRFPHADKSLQSAKLVTITFYFRVTPAF